MVAAETAGIRSRQPLKGLSHEGYRRAVRHSWMVRAMKFLFPMLAVLVMAGFLWASIFNAMLPENFHVDRSILQDGKLVMEAPVLTGQNKDGAFYKLKAERAIQSLSDPSKVRLENIHASVPIGGGKFAKLNAKSAILNRKTDVVTFDQSLDVTTEAGMHAHLRSGRFDVGHGELVTNDPVDINSAKGHVVARSMRMSDKGTMIQFDDHVKMTLQPSAVDAGASKRANP